MASASQDAFPPVWRALGLSVAVGYAGLGSYAFFAPLQGASIFGLRPQTTAVSIPENDKYTSAALAWIGARDLSIATALFAFYLQGKPKEMGTLILSGMILCAVDSVYVYRARRDAFAVSIGLGALGWAWIGWNLFNL